jgi:hypothetical protein
MDPPTVQPADIPKPKKWEIFEAEYLVVRTAKKLDVAKIKEILAIPGLPLHRIQYVEEEICQVKEKKQKTGEMYASYSRGLARASAELEILTARLPALESQVESLCKLRDEFTGMILTEAMRMASASGVSEEHLALHNTMLEGFKTSKQNVCDLVRNICKDIRQIGEDLKDTKKMIESLNIDIERLGSDADTAIADAAILEEIRLLVRTFGNDRHNGK